MVDQQRRSDVEGGSVRSGACQEVSYVPTVQHVYVSMCTLVGRTVHCEVHARSNKVCNTVLTIWTKILVLLLF